MRDIILSVTSGPSIGLSVADFVCVFQASGRWRAERPTPRKSTKRYFYSLWLDLSRELHLAVMTVRRANFTEICLQLAFQVLLANKEKTDIFRAPLTLINFLWYIFKISRKTR